LHQKALEDLTVCIDQNKKETIDNLDVILKWITIRLFDTNLTTLRKTLSYLEALLNMLSAQSFHLSDYEANVFIPLLIDRSGANSSEPIKLAMRGLFKQLCNVYPSSKTFRFVLDGLKSKNWRTRVECLEELTSLINRHGLGVCTPAKALPAIATHLADRDPSVRTAALNTFLQAYSYAGEELWKHLVGISENQRAMLEAHFKRDKLKTEGGDGVSASPGRSLSSLGTTSTPSHSPVKSRSTGNLSGQKSGRGASPSPTSVSPTPKPGKPSPKLDFDSMGIQI
jgi:cytoskeleton-associated protein 5